MMVFRWKRATRKFFLRSNTNTWSKDIELLYTLGFPFSLTENIITMEMVML
jgi:hypothetical protein